MKFLELPTCQPPPSSTPPSPLDLNSNSESDFGILSLASIQLSNLDMALWIASSYYHAHLNLKSNSVTHCTYMSLISYLVVLGFVVFLALNVILPVKPPRVIPHWE